MFQIFDRKSELKALIETLEQDIKTHPESEKYNFEVDIMQKALAKAQRDLEQIEG